MAKAPKPFAASNNAMARSAFRSASGCVVTAAAAASATSAVSSRCSFELITDGVTGRGRTAVQREACTAWSIPFFFVNLASYEVQVRLGFAPIDQFSDDPSTFSREI